MPMGIDRPIVSVGNLWAMNYAQHGQWCRSETIAWVGGAPLTFKTNFLDQAKNMQAPEVCELVFRFAGTVGAVTGGALGRDAAKLFSNITVRDDEELINSSGAMLRVLEQVEAGNKQQDPADITSGSTNTTYQYLLKFYFEPIRAARPRDFTLPVIHLLEAGQIVVLTAAALPTGWATAQSDWTVQVFARVVDGRVRELKSRRRVFEDVVSQQEFEYQVNGSIRNLILGSALTTTGYTSLASYTTLDSRTLNLPPRFETSLLLDLYRRYSDSLGSADEAALATPGAQIIIAPSKRKKIGEMIDTKTVHLRLATTAPTTGRLLKDIVVDRSGNMAALSEGYQSTQDLAMAMKKHGFVVGMTENIPVSQFDNRLVRRLPVRIKPEGDI